MNILKNKNMQAVGLYMIGNFFNKAISLIMLPILTRIMTTSEYGTLNTYLSWVSIFTVIVGLSLGTSYRTAVTDFKEDMPRYTSSMYGLSLVSAALTTVITLIVFSVLKLDMSIPMLLCCLAQSYMIFVIDSISTKYMMEQKYVKRTLLMAGPNLLTAIICIPMILVLDEQRYWGRIWSYVVVYVVIGTLLLISSFKEGKCFYNKTYWKYSLKYSTPLILHSLSCVILSSSDRIMLTNMRSSAETGVYSLIYNLSMVANVVTASMESVWVPWFTRKMNENKKKDINTVVVYYVEIVSVLIGIILLVSPEVIKLIAPAKFWDGMQIIMPIVLASYIAYLYSIMVDLEYFYKVTKGIAINTIVAASINIVLNFVFIPTYGAIAAAYTTVVAYTVSFILHYCQAKRLDKELFSILQFLPSIIVVIFISLISSICIDNMLARMILAVIVGIGYVLVWVKSDRKNLLKKG